ncbi:glycyl-radical enzyme activating protein [Sporomusa malonica]|nr:glycyl-radical enzyme activating protein [Sporomusa malonica]
MKPCSGNIFQIQRWSLHDGEGIRSTIFFKGCPLRCKWCSNPESWNGNPEVCPTGARKTIGSTVTVEDVLKVVKRDAVFYRESGGGVTFSGGEPFAQPEFLRQLTAACSQLGIDTAVETSGYFDFEQVKDIFEQLDCVFVDIKHMDDEVHKKMTGVSNRKILENIKQISRMHPNTIVRVPFIEEVNANEQNIKAMCEYLSHTRVVGVELLPYHDFGQSKYSAMGIQGQDFTTPAAAKIDDAKRIIADYGICIVDFK